MVVLVSFVLLCIWFDGVGGGCYWSLLGYTFAVVDLSCLLLLVGGCWQLVGLWCCCLLVWWFSIAFFARHELVGVAGLVFCWLLI